MLAPPQPLWNLTFWTPRVVFPTVRKRTWQSGDTEGTAWIVSYTDQNGDRHTKLTVEFDDRIASGELDLPGLPPMTGGEGSDYEVISWREVTPQP